MELRAHGGTSEACPRWALAEMVDPHRLAGAAPGPYADHGHRGSPLASVTDQARDQHERSLAARKASSARRLPPVTVILPSIRSVIALDFTVNEADTKEGIMR